MRIACRGGGGGGVTYGIHIFPYPLSSIVIRGIFGGLVWDGLDSRMNPVLDLEVGSILDDKYSMTQLPKCDLLLC